MDIRDATAADEGELWALLAWAASMTGPLAECIATAKADPYLGGYVRDFGARDGDLGVLAVEGDAVVGGAWLRLAAADAPSHSVASATEPELAIASTPVARGKGAGGALLAALLVRADKVYPATVLSVRAANPSVRLYLRHGYEEVRRVVNRVGGESIVMRRASGPVRSG